MGYLIDQLAWWLILTALAAAVAGWAFHKMRNREREAALTRDRDALRRDLLGFVEGAPESANGFLGHERETELLRTRVSIAEGRIVELERALEDARTSRDEALARSAALERNGAAAADHSGELADLRAFRADVEQARAAELEVEAVPVPAAEPQWRLRYLESRVRFLEAGKAERAAAELASARARIADLEAAARAPAPPQANEVNALSWQARYLGARVRYLETSRPLSVSAVASQPAPAPAESEETARRRAWRMQYMETRLGHVEEVATDASAAWSRHRGQLEEQLAAAHAQIAALGAERAGMAQEMERRAARVAELEPLEPLADRTRRLTWRARYLDARVRHLERLGTAAPAPSAAPQPLAAEVQDEAPAAPAPLVAPGQEVRPPALPAARDGAPDDFTLIEPVTPLQQSTLNSLGVFHFDQLAAWTPANVAWVDQYLRLRGRISTERWVEQAGALARGESAA